MAAAVFFLYLLVVALLAFVAFQFTAWYRHKRLDQAVRTPPPGFEPSDEINIDPTTGVRQRVWFNPKTGERYYEKLK